MTIIYVLLTILALRFYYKNVTEKKLPIAFINNFCMAFLLFFIEGIIENYDFSAQSITIPQNGILKIMSACIIVAIVALLFSSKKANAVK